MTICERITGILAERGIMKKAVCQTLGISPSTFSTWLTANTSSIPSEYIPPLADMFGITCDELLTGKPGSTVNETEERLLDIFRSLDWDSQQIILASAVTEKRNAENREHAD